MADQAAAQTNWALTRPVEPMQLAAETSVRVNPECSKKSNG
jgi:hypothetical protein